MDGPPNARLPAELENPNTRPMPRLHVPFPLGFVKVDTKETGERHAIGTSTPFFSHTTNTTKHAADVVPQASSGTTTRQIQPSG